MAAHRSQHLAVRIGRENRSPRPFVSDGPDRRPDGQQRAEHRFDIGGLDKTFDNAGYDNLERLDHVRKTMFAAPESFGIEKLVAERQAGPGGKFAENMRHEQAGVMFVGLNEPGSNNNKVADDEACTKKKRAPPNNAPPTPPNTPSVTRPTSPE